MESNTGTVEETVRPVTKPEPNMPTPNSDHGIPLETV